MVLLEDLAKGATPETFAFGIGAALLAPVLAPAPSEGTPAAALSRPRKQHGGSDRR
jgi:hypothetical protein